MNGGERINRIDLVANIFPHLEAEFARDPSYRRCFDNLIKGVKEREHSAADYTRGNLAQILRRRNTHTR